MKRSICVLLALAALTVLPGCGGQSGADSALPPAVVMETDGSVPTPALNVISDAAVFPAELGDPENGIDIDLTRLSSTMVYSEVYSMVYSPEEFVGKVVKMRGQFSVSQGVLEDGSPDPEKLYFACVIADATACCAQGLEFALDGDYAYPEDYPEIGSEITVTGQFELYEEEGYLYIRLRDAAMEDM